MICSCSWRLCICCKTTGFGRNIFSSFSGHSSALGTALTMLSPSSFSSGLSTSLSPLAQFHANPLMSSRWSPERLASRAPVMLLVADFIWGNLAQTVREGKWTPSPQMIWMPNDVWQTRCCGVGRSVAHTAAHLQPLPAAHSHTPASQETGSQGRKDVGRTGFTKK